jgi:hypothetical protein
MGAMSYCPRGVRLARMVALSYHFGAIMDGDQKGQSGRQKPMAGRHRKLKNIVCRGGRVGRELGE